MRLWLIEFFTFLALPLLAQNNQVSPPKALADAPVIVPEGGFADFTISVPKDAAVVWRFSPQPIQRAKDLPPGRIIFGGKAGTTYTATAFVIDFNAKTVTDADYIFVFGGKPVPPIVDPPPTDPTTGFYFMIVRPDGPASPEFTKRMGDPAWVTIQTKGHKVKDFTATRARELGAIVPTGAILPGVIILKEEGNKSTVRVPLAPLPSDPLKLLEGLK